MSETAVSDGKIECRIDGARVHSIKIHLKNHPDWTIERYEAEFPGAPLLSQMAATKLAERMKSAKPAAGEQAIAGVIRKPFHEVFELGTAKAAMNHKGQPILITTLTDLTGEAKALVPDVDGNYVFNIELTKTAIIALELNMPAYFWGFHGTGKTSAWEQVHARTGRPFLRVQHTINTEEADILGQWTVRDGATIFNPGPLTVAMIEGYTYCADEYDFAMPSVTSVYQPVLEGKPLVIKNAPPEFRVIRPHRNFRFVATGNTNGIGDETGLYQGTQMGNAANYSRFGVTEEVGYMTPSVEAIVVANQSRINRDDATKIVEFAGNVRTAYKGGKIGSTVSPRELINAGTLGLARGCNWREGLRLAFTNRLSRVDKEVVDQYAQRVFG